MYAAILYFAILKDDCIHYNLLMSRDKSFSGLVLFTLAYPAAHFLVGYIPNPSVPNANLAINMIFPILAGYFYGPLSGALAGLAGTALSAVITGDVYDSLAIFPHTLMGAAAGVAGNSRQQSLAACSILLGHALNVLFFWRFDYLSLDKPFTLTLGLLTETTIDLVAVMLVIVLFHRRLYREDERRW